MDNKKNKRRLALINKRRVAGLKETEVLELEVLETEYQTTEKDSSKEMIESSKTEDLGKDSKE